MICIRAGADAACIHGDIRQSQREATMRQYREGKLGILIATDVASRGIDVDDVDCVVNYDVPEENEYYIHRIGRTGRAKKKGVAWSIVGNFPEKAKLDEIAKFAGFRIVPMIFDEYGSSGARTCRGKAPDIPQALLMRPAEEGLLLLCCALGTQDVPLTPAQYRTLARRVRPEPVRPETAR